MTSSTAEFWSVHLRTGNEHVVARPGARKPSPVRVEPHRQLVIEVRGVPVSESVTVTIGNDDQELIIPGDGVLRWSPSHLLEATAGMVSVTVTRPDGDDRTLALDIKPTKFAERNLQALLDDLEQLAPGLSSDLGGAGFMALRRHEDPEAILAVMESTAGIVAQAAAHIRKHPLHRRTEQVTAVPSSASRTTARDVRWLCRHPAAQLRATMGGHHASVHRRIDHDLDVPENRGAIGMLGHFQTLLDEMSRLLDDDRWRLEAGRAEREAFRTERGNLYEERDLPRLRAIAKRQRRIETLAGEISRARVRTGLPARLPHSRLHRSARVESHPGYWGLYRVAQQIQDLRTSSAPVSLAPVNNLDDLYETWCVITLAAALAEWAGTTMGEILRLEESGWFVRLPRGEIARVTSGDREFRLHYEPRYPFRGDGPLVKLIPGLPWVPDLVLEESVSGYPVNLHVFDAKHRIDPTRPDLLPLDAVRETWFKYTDSIGFRENQLPAVSSTWVLFPGGAPFVHLISPRMLAPDWPAERARGGAISLLPGMHGASAELRRLLKSLLGPSIRA